MESDATDRSWSAKLELSFRFCGLQVDVDVVPAGAEDDMENKMFEILQLAQGIQRSRPGFIDWAAVGGEITLHGG